ncbi:MAG: ABC transporter permease subunit [Pseudomonadota bacterium]
MSRQSARRLTAWLSRRARLGVVAVPYAWLLVFFAAPFLIVLKISLSEPQFAQPPYAPLVQWGEDLALEIRLNLANYSFLTSDRLYWVAYLSSAKIAFFSTLICLVIGYPMAYAIARADPRWRTGLLMLIILPFWTSFLIRVYAWMGLLRDNGVINNALIWLGVIDQPVQMLQTDFAVYLGITYSYLPFMILPLFASLQRLDSNLLEAAADLGCPPWRTFLSITLPLSLPGIIAGSLLVFIPAVGEFVIPALLGGPETLMIGRVLWDEFFVNRDWPLASAVAIAMLLLLVLPIMLVQWLYSREQESDA